jgi:hypothetical protein
MFKLCCYVILSNESLNFIYCYLQTVQIYTEFINDYNNHDKKNIDVALKGLIKFLSLMPCLRKDTDHSYYGQRRSYPKFYEGAKYIGKIKYYFIKFYLTIFVNDNVFYVVIIKNKSVKTKRIYLSDDNFFFYLSYLYYFFDK